MNSRLAMTVFALVTAAVGLCADAQSSAAKGPANSRVEVVSNPDAIPLELAVVGLDGTSGLKAIKGLAGFEAERVSELEEALKQFEKSQVGFLVIRKMKSGDKVMRTGQLKVAGATPSGGLFALGKNMDFLVMSDAMGNVVSRSLNADGPVLNLWPIPRQATEAVLEFPDHKPITLRFGLPAATSTATDPAPAAKAGEVSAVQGKNVRRVDIGNGVSIELVWCPPGKFTMGSPKDEKGRSDNELLKETEHLVTLTKGFWIGKYEITQEQWEAMMGNNPSKFKKAGLKAPVENVSWDDCQQFVAKLNAKFPGQAFRMPTEAEWEYACRAGSGAALHNGKELTDAEEGFASLDEIAWHRGNSGRDGGTLHLVRTGETIVFGTPQVVGQKKPNAWGLYDMSGNVFEWCQDWLGELPPEPATDPTGPQAGKYRVVRGGCCSAVAQCYRSASRGGSGPSAKGEGMVPLYFGFRLAASAQKE